MTDELPPPKPKRSFFKKPAWSNTESSQKADDDIFRRTNDTYGDIVAANARRREEAKLRKAEQKLQQEKEQEEERRRQEERAQLQKEEERQRATKRLRTSQDSFVSSSPQRGLEDTAKDVTEPTRTREGTKTRSSKSFGGVISDDDSVSLSFQIDNAPIGTASRPLQKESSPVSEDDEFPELARLAREKALRKMRESQTRTPDAQQRESSGARLSDSSLRPSQDRDTPSRKERHVEILLTSEIPGTSPLIVQRRISQGLRDVRLAWCGRQPFGEEMYDKIFLTWKGRRLFDVTTCKGLGLEQDQDNTLLEFETTNLKVHMEAMTEELFEKAKLAKANGYSAGANGDEGNEEEVQEPEPQGSRIILKRPGAEDWKLIVKPSTFIAKIIASYARNMQDAAGKEVTLIFDGEKLDPESRVEDTDIDDMDIIDVVLR